MILQQAAPALLMIRPNSFGFNPETAKTNAFQVDTDTDVTDISVRARSEFDKMVNTLREIGVNVLVFEDVSIHQNPDAVFPNNWISFHHNGTVVLYPMMALNRRSERRFDIIEKLKSNFMISNIIDLSPEELQGKFLEGTGSIVFDHRNGIAYACKSPRTDKSLFKHITHQLGYKPIFFNAVDQRGNPIYHTNVVLTVGSKFVTLCLDAIPDEDQELLLNTFASVQQKVIALSYQQMQCFAGNMFEVSISNGDSAVLVSETAFNSLLPGQVGAITRFAEMIPLRIPTIEKYGGGSVRCMVAGIYLPAKT